jgi:hypothetical protein
MRFLWTAAALLAAGLGTIVFLTLRAPTVAEGRRAPQAPAHSDDGAAPLVVAEDPSLDDGEDGAAGTAATGGPRRRAPIRRHVNEVGDYSFSYPGNWTLERAGEVSKVSSPSGHLVVAFALGPIGLPVSYEGFESLLVSTYDDVSISEVDATSVDGHNSILLRGRARNGDGRRLDFRALLVERDGARSVGAFAASDGGRFDPRLDEVLRSLRL